MTVGFPITRYVCSLSTDWFESVHNIFLHHYSDVIMGVMTSLITSLASVYSTVHSCADQRKHQSSASLAFVRGIYRKPVNSPQKWPVTRKMFPFDDVIMTFFISTLLTFRVTFIQSIMQTVMFRLTTIWMSCWTNRHHDAYSTAFVYEIRAHTRLHPA